MCLYRMIPRRGSTSLSFSYQLFYLSFLLIKDSVHVHFLSSQSDNWAHPMGKVPPPVPLPTSPTPIDHGSNFDSSLPRATAPLQGPIPPTPPFIFKLIMFPSLLLRLVLVRLYLHIRSLAARTVLRPCVLPAPRARPWRPHPVLTRLVAVGDIAWRFYPCRRARSPSHSVPQSFPSECITASQIVVHIHPNKVCQGIQSMTPRFSDMTLRPHGRQAWLAFASIFISTPRCG